MVKSILHTVPKRKLNFYEVQKFICAHFRPSPARASEGHNIAFLPDIPA
jgi:hypothetical protein